MGNTLTCCVSPNASPKLGRRAGPAEPDYESEVYEAAAGDAVAVAPAPAAAVEPAELDFGAGEGHHLQHISDREMPEGEEAAGASGPWRTSGLHRLPGSRWEAAAASGSFLPEYPGTGLGTGNECCDSRFHPLFFLGHVWPVSFQPLRPVLQSCHSLILTWDPAAGTASSLYCYVPSSGT